MKATPKPQTLAQKKKLLLTALKNGATIDAGTWAFLVESENALIQLMNNNPPGPNDPGNIEFGWVLYLINNLDFFKKDIKNPTLLELFDLLEVIEKFLQILGVIPTSKITAQDWTNWTKIWEGQGVLMGDGTLLSTAKFAQMDIGWAEAVIKFLLQKIGLEKKHSLNNTPTNTDFSQQPSLKIALFGDWGTGVYKDGNLPNSPSQLVMQQIALKKPDVMIHLGDVYYAGENNEEQANLINCWKPAPLGNFTLNSNHEMYDGANGLCNVALSNSIFKQQNNTTFFSITYGDWVILGLDSAYNATSFYMDGVINDAFQPNFIKNQAAKGKKLIVLTHHNPIDTQGLNKNALWNDVVGNLPTGRTPDVWYWGHTHNGIVYNSAAVSGNTLARCLGHAAIPFGNASWLENQQATVSFYTHDPLNDGYANNALRVKNGFAILEITGDTLTETWYDQNGVQCWSNSATV